MTGEESKAIVLRWFAELDRGNLDIVEDLIAEDYVDHNPALPNLPPGREGVMTRVTARGTFLGECIGYQRAGAAPVHTQ